MRSKSDQIVDLLDIGSHIIRDLAFFNHFRAPTTGGHGSAADQQGCTNAKDERGQKGERENAGYAALQLPLYLEPGLKRPTPIRLRKRPEFFG